MPLHRTPDRRTPSGDNSDDVAADRATPGGEERPGATTVAELFAEARALSARIAEHLKDLST